MENAVNLKEIDLNWEKNHRIIKCFFKGKKIRSGGDENLRIFFLFWPYLPKVYLKVTRFFEQFTYINVYM